MTPLQSLTDIIRSIEVPNELEEQTFVGIELTP